MHQLRLRDIGGIIVIDFIDMARARNRDAVLKIAAQGARRGPHEDLRGRDLAARAGRDDAPERHRRRARDHDQAVPDLRRRGRGASPRRRSRSRSSASCATWSHEAGDSGPEAFLLQINPRVTRAGSPPTARASCTSSRRRPASYFHFEGSEGLPLDHFAVTHGGHARGDRGARRAVPGRRGGARPHRRAAHVQRGRRGRQDRRLHDRGRQRRSPYVGEKQLVRIEEAGRTLARAVLVGDEAEEAAEAAKERAKAAKAARPPQAAAQSAKPRREARAEAGREGRAERRRRRHALGRRRRPGRRGRDARIEASAPRPQRRTAPFACEGRGQRVI